MEQSIEAISANLRCHRESRGLSLDQMAELTGVSKSMLRQIEIGNSSPTIATLWKIANGLKISFTSLLCKQPVQVDVKSFRAEAPLTDEKKHYRLFPLISFDPQQSFETYYFEIDPGTVFSGEPHSGNVFEYIFLTSGKLQLSLDDKVYEISEGEFLRFQANVPHDYACLSKKMATAIMQISYLP